MTFANMYHYLDGADVLLKATPAGLKLADKVCEMQARAIDPLLVAGRTVVIPPRPTRNVQRKFDRHLYKARHLIENCLQGSSGTAVSQLATTKLLENF